MVARSSAGILQPSAESGVEPDALDAQGLGSGPDGGADGSRADQITSSLVPPEVGSRRRNGAITSVQLP